MSYPDNYVKAGPVSRQAAIDYISANVRFPGDPDTRDAAIRLIGKADQAFTGMSARTISDGRQLWVSALLTIPGKYMIEIE